MKKPILVMKIGSPDKEPVFKAEFVPHEGTYLWAQRWDVRRSLPELIGQMQKPLMGFSLKESLREGLTQIQNHVESVISHLDEGNYTVEEIEDE